MKYTAAKTKPPPRKGANHEESITDSIRNSDHVRGNPGKRDTDSSPDLYGCMDNRRDDTALYRGKEIAT